MGRLGRRLDRYEGDDRERARREVHRRCAAISDGELREVFFSGRPWREIPLEDFGLTVSLANRAIGLTSNTPPREAVRRGDELLNPLWRRLEDLRPKR